MWRNDSLSAWLSKRIQTARTFWRVARQRCAIAPNWVARIVKSAFKAAISGLQIVLEGATDSRDQWMFSIISLVLMLGHTQTANAITYDTPEEFLSLHAVLSFALFLTVVAFVTLQRYPKPLKLLLLLVGSGALIHIVARFFMSLGLRTSMCPGPETPHDIVMPGVCEITPSYEMAVYFSVITFTTLGYGDYQPSEQGRTIAWVHAIFGVIFLGALVAVGASDGPKTIRSREDDAD